MVLSVKKILSGMLSLLMIGGIVGCGEKNTSSFEVDPNDFTLDFGNGESQASSSDGYNEETEDSKQSETSQNNNSKNNSSKETSVSSSNVSSTVSLGFEGDDYVSNETESEAGEKVPEFIELPSLEKANKLSNSLNILKEGKDLKVVYFGGSVTGGTGASNAEKTSWRALTTKYLKTYGNVIEAKKSIGGTGSYLGIARFEKDVMAEDPDLVFIEFFVNDGYSAIPKETSVKNLEYMIRTLYEHNPHVDIVIVLVTNKDSFGEKGARYQAFERVAGHYKLPCVDLGTGFYNHIKGKKNRWLEFFADSVHPNDKGYTVYADVMKNALEQLLVKGNSSKHNLPSLLDKNGYSSVINLTPNTFNPINANNIDKNSWGIGSWYSSDDYEKSGTQFRTSHIKNYFPNYIYPKSNGASLTFKFTGNSFGLLGNIKEGSSLTVILDGKTEVKLNGSSKSELLEYPVFADIKNTEHTVTIKANGKPPYIAIASFTTTK